ncbi:MAG: phage antirepressor KilAC domain-containing protein [Chitinophagaceae bacterium]|nr:phage antirepressor KilAC domain-containing protein [Chitinophagaceae bacterium]
MNNSKMALTSIVSQSQETTTLPQQILVRGRRSASREDNGYPLYIPQNIYLDDLLEKYPVNVPNAKEYLFYLMDLIYRVPAFSKNVDLAEQGGFTYLNSTYLQNVVDNYAPLMQWLIARGILLTDGVCKKGKKSTGFKFAPEYWVDLKEVVIYGETLVRKLRERRWKKKARKEKDKITLQPAHLFIGEDLPEIPVGATYSSLAKSKYNHLFKWFKEGIEVEYEKAVIYLNEEKERETQLVGIEIAHIRYICRKMVLDRLVNWEDDFAFVDETSGRLHSPFTYLSSKLRAFIKFRGKTLAAADIKNCQPLLSLVFLDFDLFEKCNIAERLIVFNPSIYGDANSSSLSIISMLGDFIQAKQNNPDVKIYKEKVLDGSLYEYFAERLLENGFTEKEIGSDKRGFAKEGVFKSFFCTNRFIGTKHGKILRVFKLCFPTVYEIFAKIKMGRHETLACILQNIEADLVLNKTGKQISLIKDDAFLLTIHDSIISTEDNYELIEKVLYSVLRKYLGIDVKIKKEIWDYENMIEKKRPIATTVSEEEDVSGYGYAELEQTYKPKAFSMKKAAQKLELKSNRQLLAFLRENGIIAYNEFRENVIVPEFENTGYFSISELRIRGRGITRSIRVTELGLEFIASLLNESNVCA